MSTRVVDRVDDWEQRPFSGGFDGLADLEADEVSGVLRAAGAEVYLTGGTVIAVRRGSIDDLAEASGTLFSAPDPVLPLLAIMQEADADVRAEYYSEETPLTEVDGTLSDGGFTGFVELSENVLSGDYYVVYHGGTSSSVAFVGASAQLVSGDEAFQKADEEVGIYKVRQVDIDPVDVPTPAPSPDAAGDAQDPEADAPPAPTEPEDDAGEDTEPEGDTESAPDAPDAASPPEPPGDTAETSDGAAPTVTAEERPGGEPGGAGQDSGRPQPEAGGDASVQDRRAETSTSPRRDTTESVAQAADLETRGVPSLDPDQTTQRPAETGAGPVEQRGQRTETPAPSGGTRSTQARGASEPSHTQETRSPEPEGAEAADLEADIAEREERIEELEADLAAARSDREDLEQEVERVREERDALQTEVETLREELDRLEADLGAATDAERRMSPAEAIEATNLFVDYASKGQATLEKAHGGSETRDDLVENLQLGVHTEFDQGSVAVGGQEFDAFLRDTLQYRFAEWVVGQLLFEIRDTGHADALADLYDAIPEIRRVEFDGTIDVEYVEDGQETVASEGFDVIFRHRMGDPLLVANLNDSRDPATGSMMTSLVTAGERVGQTEPSLAAAFLVTSSFFESAALETVAEATKGGIFSRDKRSSFVNLSRKTGYHLCLVAAREGNFHMEVPEL